MVLAILKMKDVYDSAVGHRNEYDWKKCLEDFVIFDASRSGKMIKAKIFFKRYAVKSSTETPCTDTC